MKSNRLHRRRRRLHRRCRCLHVMALWLWRVNARGKLRLLHFSPLSLPSSLSSFSLCCTGTQIVLAQSRVFIISFPLILFFFHAAVLWAK